MSRYSELFYGRCKECNQTNTDDYWCRYCNAQRFQQSFKNWTSGNDNIDKFIQDAQLSATNKYKVLEWIPYDRFYDIKYIAKGGFSEVHRAKWIDGYILEWDNMKLNWKRESPDMFVALKSLDNSKNVTLGFINEITTHRKIRESSGCIVTFYGITQEPGTNNYIMVLEYAEHGSLRNYLDQCYSNLDWKDKIDYIWDIALGLDKIHENGLIHRNLHIGNILKYHGRYACISDMGLCKPADYNALENTRINIYGVLPYIAPEILQGRNYTAAADVYSFGIIMYEIISGLPPYHDISHDENLAIKICQGLRPKFNIRVPQSILHLIKQCLDANPSNRPTAKEIRNILSQWWNELHGNQINSIKSELIKQIKVAEVINMNSPTSSIPLTSLALSYHPEAIYTSRLLDFNNLPEPKNSDDYYKQYDNISSMEYPESLQIGMARLKINDADEMEGIEKINWIHI